MPFEMPSVDEMPSWFVYFLRSCCARFLYVGSTNRLHERLLEHNAGMVQSTKVYRPLRMVAYIAVCSERQARRLEAYFKTGSGKAVLKKRILTDEVLSSGT